MPASFFWLNLSTDSKFAKTEGWLTLFHLIVNHSVNFVCSKAKVFPGRAYLLNDTYLIRTYEIVNEESLKI